MGWGSGRLTGWNPATKAYETRDVGYMHAATCDVPGCKARIDRGLGWRCGGRPEDVASMGDTLEAHGCGAYLCGEHEGDHDCPKFIEWYVGTTKAARDAYAAAVRSGETLSLPADVVVCAEGIHVATEEILDLLANEEDVPCRECMAEVPA